MRRDLAGKRMIITGASSGIGRALAVDASRRGAHVVLAARSEDKLRDLASTLPSETLVVRTDVTREEDRQALLDRTVERFGGIDVLVNNAGVASWAHFGESSEAVLRQVMEVNFFAPADLIRRAVPILTAGRQPAIVNVASRCGRKAMPAWPEYSASKHALCGLTESLRGEFARFDIDVLLVVPGLTATELPDRLLLREGRAKIEFSEGMPPAEVAAAIVRALERNTTETWVGRDCKWMLRLNRYFPRLVDRLVARKVRKLYS